MKTPVSPKVTSGANWAAYSGFILTILNMITPDMLAPLGHWAPLVYCGISGLAFAAGAWRKEDPLRTAGAKALAQEVPAVVPGVSPDDIQRLLDALAAKLEQPAPEPKTVPVTVTPQPGI